MKFLSILFFLLINVSFLISQSANLSDGSMSTYFMDRYEIKSNQDFDFHSSIRPFLREDAVRVGEGVLRSDSSLTKIDRRNIQYIFNDNNEWLGIDKTDITLIGGKNAEVTLNEASIQHPNFKKRKPLLKHFYKTPANLFEVNTKDFNFRANPMLNLGYANAQNDVQPVFLNQRGVEFRGGVDDRIFFYSNITESQARFADYATQRIRRDRAVPGAGFYKVYRSEVFDITDGGFDFLNAQGYLGFNISEHIGVQLGHGKIFIGNGYRSLLLSDWANNYYHLKFNWRVWKFQLQNIFAELSAEDGGGRVGLLPKKYMASHYLDYNILPNLSIGFFETVVFSRNNNFEFQYLNPLILYRTVEQMIGSPDNVLIGLNGKWNLMNKFQLYGQVVLDEFKFDELFLDNNGWWANKYGVQAGVKYIDAFGIDQLDLQFETNAVRPYTYTHFDSTSVYSHFHQPLAHPAGANFREYIGILRYQPLKNLFIELRAISMKAGESEQGLNWGENINISNGTREQDFGNEFSQGTTYDNLIISGNVSYQLFQSCFVDLSFFSRNKDSDNDAFDLQTTYIGGGFRLNTSLLRLDF